MLQETVRRAGERDEERARENEAEKGGERAKSPNDWRYILRRDRSLPRLDGVNFSMLYTCPPIPGTAPYLSSIAFHPSLAAGKSLWVRSYWWGASSTTLRKIDNWLYDSGRKARVFGNGRMCDLCHNFCGSHTHTYRSAYVYNLRLVTDVRRLIFPQKFYISHSQWLPRAGNKWLHVYISSREIILDSEKVEYYLRKLNI